MSLTPTTTQPSDLDRYNALVNKVADDAFEIFRQMRDELGGRLPAELSYGIVAGYLRGKGYTWEEAMAGMDRHIRVIQSLVKPEHVEGTMTIHGQTDGSVNVALSPAVAASTP